MTASHVLLLTAGASAGAGQAATPTALTFGMMEAFTFLFVAIGPIAIVPSFAALVQGRDSGFARSLALRGTGLAALTVVLTATIGAMTLDAWGVSRPALQAAAGLLLLLISLAALMSLEKDVPRGAATDATAIGDLALRPLAFPIIMPAFSLCVVALTAQLAQEAGQLWQFYGLVLLILAMDLVGMIGAVRMMRIASVRLMFEIIGSMMGALQVGLAIQTIWNAFRAG